MLQQPLYPNPQVIYEADQAHVDTVKTLREKIHSLCKSKLMHKHVKVQTLDGHEYEGVIVFIDGGQLYLSLAEDEELMRSPYPYGPVPPRPPYPPYGPVPHHPYPPYSPYPPVPAYGPGGAILPLVLYDLLAITLLM
ncbi:hypothetical protein [Gorillibacterium sp. sgz5001074]|uniref:hypothetical protein n=1 Tax=Gorillibacterium sp. sgz5001074 TaxID=3446695 RepID=UPI003F662E32